MSLEPSGVRREDSPFSLLRHQCHPALGTGTGLLGNDIGMHGAGVQGGWRRRTALLMGAAVGHAAPPLLAGILDSCGARRTRRTGDGAGRMLVPAHVLVAR